MNHTYFNINYEFDRSEVHRRISDQIGQRRGSAYICVADGVVLNMANREPEYLKTVKGSMFSICDSSYVPVYIRWIHGARYSQYCGSEIFRDIVSEGRYRMIFLGAQRQVLDGLRENLATLNPSVKEMSFVELPFKPVEEFDYEGIARMIEADGAQIVWVALGAPKQEQFMARLQPHLSQGVMIAVGAAFKFFSGTCEVKRAPEWMVRRHMEFLYRIYSEPRKQLNRCAWIVRTLPGLLYGEWQRKRAAQGLPKSPFSTIL